MDANFETLIASYIENKVGIANHFLSDDLCYHLKSNLLALNENLQMKSAGIGNDTKMLDEAIVSKIYLQPCQSSSPHK